MRLFTLIRARKMKRLLRRAELKKKEQLSAEFTQRIDKHGFPMRTHWPD